MKQAGGLNYQMMATFVIWIEIAIRFTQFGPEIVALISLIFQKLLRGPKYPKALENPVNRDYHVRFDLDMNGHVNSKYLDWIFEVMGRTSL